MPIWPFKKSRQVTKAAGNFVLPLDKQLPFLLPGYKPGNDNKFNSLNLAILYNTVGAVNAIINYISQKVGEIPVQHVRYQSNGKKKVLGETEQLKLIQSPEPGKSGTVFISEIAASLMIQGNAPVWFNRTPGFTVPTRSNLLAADSVYAIPRLTMDQYGTPQLTADPRSNEIVRYHMLINGRWIVIPLEEVCYIRNINPNKTGRDWYYGMSPLYGAIRNIDILSGLYDTINTVTQYRGALGFVSKVSRANQLDILPAEDLMTPLRERFLERYGTGKQKDAIAFTPYDLKWVKIDAPISDFLPVEIDEKQFGHICNQFHIADVLLNSKLSSTYNNVKEAQVSSYQNCMMPLLETILRSLSEYLGMTARNEWFEGDFSGISALQEDELDKYKALNEKRTYYVELYNAGMITKNQALTGLEMPENTDPSFNQIKDEKETNGEGAGETEAKNDQGETQG
jgi:phage portal protein BeeE